MVIFIKKTLFIFVYKYICIVIYIFNFICSTRLNMKNIFKNTPLKHIWKCDLYGARQILRVPYTVETFFACVQLKSHIFQKLSNHLKNKTSSCRFIFKNDDWFIDVNVLKCWKTQLKCEKKTPSTRFERLRFVCWAMFFFFQFNL